MHSHIQSINAMHKLNLKKADFHDFAKFKSDFDKFLNIILSGPPILQYNLESADKYREDHENRQFTTSFYHTFKLSEDGYDDLAAVKHVRYIVFVRHILQKINSKFNLNVLITVDRKPAKLASFMYNVATIAKMVLLLKSEINTIMVGMESKKKENIKLIENIKIREQKALENKYTKDELLEKFKSLQDQLFLLKEQYNLKLQEFNEGRQQIEQLKVEMSKTKIKVNQINEEKSRLIENIKKLQPYAIHDPEILKEKLLQLKKIHGEETKKFNEMYKTCININKDIKEFEGFKLKINSIKEYQKTLKEDVVAWEIDNKKIRSLKQQQEQLKIQINHLNSIREKKLKDLKNRENYLLQMTEDIPLLKEEIRKGEYNISAVTEELRTRQFMIENKKKEIDKYEKTIDEMKAACGNDESNYLTVKKNLELNVEQSLEELQNQYIQTMN